MAPASARRRRWAPWAAGRAAGWLSEGRSRKEDSQVNTLAGFAGAYGGLFSSTVIVVLLILEVARPGGRRFTKALAAEIVASSVSFGIYFAIAGAVFLDDYQVPSYKFEDWQLLAGIPLGLFAAVLVTLLVGFMMGAARLFGRLKAPAIAKSTLGGRGVRDRRRGAAADDVLRRRSAQDRTHGRGGARPGPASPPS